MTKALAVSVQKLF